MSWSPRKLLLKKILQSLVLFRQLKVCFISFSLSCLSLFKMTKLKNSTTSNQSRHRRFQKWNEKIPFLSWKRSSKVKSYILPLSYSKLGTKGLTIDFESNFKSSFSPKPDVKSSVLEPKPASEVTVTRSHTVVAPKTAMQRPKPRQPVLSPTLTTNLESINSFNQNNQSTMSISSSEKSSVPSNTLNPAQLQVNYNMIQIRRYIS